MENIDDFEKEIDQLIEQAVAHLNFDKEEIAALLEQAAKQIREGYFDEK